MFRKERYVYINGIKISNNGFRNLSFETSRFSDGLSAIRGFGNVMSERNLNIIDVFNLEFVVDYKELKNFAKVYAMFKAFGALPLQNEYILEKIKNSTVEKMVEESKRTTSQKNKNVSHVIVLLERMAVTSLENTDNGYNVSMTFTLFRHGFSDVQYQQFNEMFTKWDTETGFTKIVDSNIDRYIRELSASGGLTVRIANLERLNFKFKKTILENTSSDIINDEEVYIESQQKRYDEISSSGEDYDKEESIDIHRKHIGQIEFITHNNISNLPLHGEPIGLKSFIGIGYSSLIVKMIFDERSEDKEILEKLKLLSDKNIINHRMTLEFPFINMFDFKNAYVSNIFFNNVEQSNGVLVTIKFNINAFNHMDEQLLNSGATVNQYNMSNYSSSEAMAGLYLESLVQKVCETTSFPHSDMKALLETIIESESMTSNEKTSLDTERYSRFYMDTYIFADWLASYSQVSSTPFYHKAGFGSVAYESSRTGDNFYEVSTSNNAISFTHNPVFNFEESSTVMNEEQHKKVINKIIKKVYGNTGKDDAIKKLGRDLEYGTSFIKYFDLFGFMKMFADDKTYQLFINELDPGRSYSYNNSESERYSNRVNTSDFVSDTIKDLNDKAFLPILDEMFNQKQNLLSDDENLIYKAIYREYLTNVNEVMCLTINDELSNLKNSSFQFSNGSFKLDEIKKIMDSMSDKIMQQFLYVLNNVNFHEKLAKVLYEAREYHGRSAENKIEEEHKQYVESVRSITESLYRKYSSIISTEADSIKSSTYSVMLTKFLYPALVSKCNIIQNSNETIGVSGDYILDNSAEKLIKSFAISSALMTPFFMITDAVTAPVGFCLKIGSRVIGKRLNTAMTLYAEANKEEFTKIAKANGGETLEFAVKEIAGKVFDGYTSNSYYINNISLANGVARDELSTTEINKDYDFFFGNKITRKHPELFMSDVINSGEFKSEAAASVSELIEKSREDYINGDDFCDYIKTDKISMMPAFDVRTAPDAIRDKLSLNSDGTINDRMKRRLIGKEDPFTSLEKIKDIIVEGVDNVMPDYDVMIGKVTYNYENTGIYNFIKLQEHAELSNIASIRISKNPETKIKSCIIQIVDVNKALYNAYAQYSTISVKTNNDGTIGLFSIAAGDDIKINLGTSKKKKRVFNGIITNLKHNGNLIEITCSSYASALYARAVEEVKLGKAFAYDNYASFIWHASLKSLEKDSMASSQIDEYMGKYKTSNSHIFVNDSMEAVKKTLASTGEEASMYTAFIYTLSNMASETKKYFMNDYDNGVSFGSLVNRKQILSNLRNAQGNMNADSDPRSTTSVSMLYSNLFNVDVDYETYGLCGADGNSLLKYQKKKEKDNFLTRLFKKNEKVEDDKVEYTEDTGHFNRIKSLEKANKVGTVSTKAFSIPAPANDKRDYSVIFPTDSRTISSLFGYREIYYNSDKPLPKNGQIIETDKKNNRVKVRTMHRGIDIAPRNSDEKVTENVYAALDGIVTDRAYNASEGNYIVIKHEIPIFSSNGKQSYKEVSTLYCHLRSDTALKRFNRGSKVKKGDVIGNIGNTGIGTGKHLHFEIFTGSKGNRESMNPLDLLERYLVNYTGEVVEVEEPEEEVVYEYEDLIYNVNKSSWTSGHVHSTFAAGNDDSGAYSMESLPAPEITFYEKKPGEIFNFYQESILDSRWDVRERADYSSIILGRDYYFYNLGDRISDKIRKLSDLNDLDIISYINSMADFNKNSLYRLLLEASKVVSSLGFDELFDITTGSYYYENIKADLGVVDLKMLMDRDSVRRVSETHFAISGFNLIHYNVGTENNIPNTVSTLREGFLFEKDYKEQLSISGSQLDEDIYEIGFDPFEEQFRVDGFGERKKNHGRWLEKAANMLIKETEYVNQGKIFVSFNPDIEIGDSFVLLDPIGSTYGRFRVDTFEHVLDDRGIYTVVNIKALADVSDPIIDMLSYKVSSRLIERMEKEIMNTENGKTTENYVIKNIFATYAKSFSICPKYTTFSHKGKKNAILENNGCIPTIVPYRIFPMVKKGTVQLSKSMQVFYSDTNSKYFSYYTMLMKTMADAFRNGLVAFSDGVKDLFIGVLDILISMPTFGLHELLKPMLGITESKAHDGTISRSENFTSPEFLTLYGYSPYDGKFNKVIKNNKTIGFFNIQCMDPNALTLTSKGKFNEFEHGLNYNKKFDALRRVINDSFDVTLIVEAYDTWKTTIGGKSIDIKTYMDSLQGSSRICHDPIQLHKGSYYNDANERVTGTEYGYIYSPHLDDAIKGVEVLNIDGERNAIVVEFDVNFFPEINEGKIEIGDEPVIEKLEVVFFHNLFGGDDQMAERKRLSERLISACEKRLDSYGELRDRHAMIVMGDFNLQIVSKDPSAKPHNTSHNRKNGYITLGTDSSFDSYIDKPTTLDSKGRPYASVYDNILVTDNISSRTVAARYIPDMGNTKLNEMSDHIPVFVYFKK